MEYQANLLDFEIIYRWANTVKMEAECRIIKIDGENARKQFIKSVHILNALKLRPGNAIKIIRERLISAGFKNDFIDFMIKTLSDYFNSFTQPEYIPLQNTLNILCNNKNQILGKK
ncbi:MAG: hypothetical protein HUU54_13370 [Ignavibacteriaceae bacterium]|nr:hypothetical protein [Ignavibacteriaceae bacterium]